MRHKKIYVLPNILMINSRERLGLIIILFRVQVNDDLMTTHFEESVDQAS